MAYTQNPENSTYKTLPVAFDGRSLYRNGDLTDQRDLQIVNMYYDTIFQDSQNKQAVKRLMKRPGLASTTYSLTKAAASSEIRGSYYDTDQNAMYWAVDDKLYSVNPDVSATTRLVATLNTSSGLVGFCSFLKSDNTRYVVASDGTDIWIDDYVAVSCSRVVDADLPTPHEPSPIYLDGYLFIIAAGTGDIYNSDLDDPTGWTPGDFITAEISSDYLLRLVKAKNYIVALGYNSIEYFYDAGNVSGSPLARNDSPFRSVGYISGLSTISDVTYFIGQDERHGIGIFSIENFDVSRISTPVVDRTLQPYVATQNTKSRALLNRPGYAVSFNGRTFYVVPTSTTTWIFDIETKEWYEWKGSDGTGLDIEASWIMYNGAMYVALGNQTSIAIMSPAVYQDFGVNFTCRYTSELVDGGTINWKYGHRMALDSSQEATSGTSNLTVTWSDNDWKSASTTTRSINLFSLSPYAFRLGRFRKRSFRFEYSDNYPLWLRGFYLDINVGQI